MRSAALGSHRRLFEEGPDIGAATAAGLAGKLGLKIGQANIVRPLGGIYHDRMRAFEVAAVDDQPARAVVRPHFPEGDFLLALHSGFLP